MTVGGQYFRNASGLTDFTFQAGDARSLGGTNATDGLQFSLSVAAVPEPTSLAIVGLGVAGFGWRRWKKKA